MDETKPTKTTTRRQALKAGLAVAALPMLGAMPRQAIAQDRKVTKVHDFETAADIAKAEQEGEFLYYTHDSEPAAAGIVEAFGKDFPKIKGKYFRLQNGSLFSKTVAERSANQFNVDVIQFSEPTTALDFQKRNGYTRYVSPQSQFYAPAHLSNPVGDYFWVGVTFAGISYNTEKVKPADAPKAWKDILNPLWLNGVNVKQSNSGMQFIQWYELRKLYGDGFWKEFAKLKPKGFDSRVQLFDRLAKGDDKVCALAEYAGYLLHKEKGAPIAFVAPADGLPASPLLTGVADKAPHPEAARLFQDWMMSPRGQAHQQNNAYLYYGSVRKDAPPMPGGTRLSDFKLLSPTDIDALVASRDAFNSEWNKMLGMLESSFMAVAQPFEDSPRRQVISVQSATMAILIVVVAAFVLYPIYYLIQASLDVGEPNMRPPTAYGLGNFLGLPRYWPIILNTLVVSFAATVMALAFGFITAWILTRTNVPFQRTLEQLMVAPYYVTPLLGALAWSLLGSPESGFINQLWRHLGGQDHLIDITSPMGIAWVMALFEGSVAFVMIGAVMKSMDPSLEEASQVVGASRWRTMLRVTLPLVAPGVLGAAIFVFAEMLGSFSAALVLGTPARFYVITTAIYQLVSQYPPRIPLAAAMGVSLFAVMFLMLWLYRRVTSRKSYVTISGKAFRPRVMDVGWLRWVLFAVCASYVVLSVALPIATLLFVSIQKLSLAFPPLENFTLANFRQALSLNAVRSAMWNSVALGLVTATIGVVLTGLIAWIIQRSRLPGRGVLEYIVMFPQAVPRLVFAFGMMWAWLVFPLPIYGTFWLLLIAYLTVFLPLGVRTISGVIMQLDKSLDECGQVCGATWAYRLRSITMPLLKPGLLAAWLLIFVSSVRELGASILLMGPNSKVITPAIAEAWFSTNSELTAAMALIQTAVIGLATLIFAELTRRASRQKD